MVMQTSPIKFERFQATEEAELQDRIVAAKNKLGKKLVILGHHYQQEGVYRHADYTGDSLKLSRFAGQTDAEYIVFLGVHFMAEVADILSRPEQISILPDLSAGCSMADMANLAKVERSRRELSKVLDFDEVITPVTYINSAADLKAFCGEHGGIVCTSTNAPKILEWAFQQKEKEFAGIVKIGRTELQEAVPMTFGAEFSAFNSWHLLFPFHIDINWQHVINSIYLHIYSIGSVFHFRH
jgi:quinolinate synthase